MGQTFVGQYRVSFCTAQLIICCLVFASKMSRFFAVIFLTFFLESEALSISKETVAEPSEVLEPRTFSSEVVDLGATYDYLTNSDTSYLFLLVLAFQVNIRKYFLKYHSYSPLKEKLSKTSRLQP